MHMTSVSPMKSEQDFFFPSNGISVSCFSISPFSMSGLEYRYNGWISSTHPESSVHLQNVCSNDLLLYIRPVQTQCIQ